MTKPFADVKNDLKPDGALRDFYIQGISQTDWDRFIEIVPTITKRFLFQWGEQETTLPAMFSDIAAMQERNPTTLFMWVSGSIVACHFFVDSEIELDFKPNDFQDEGKWTELIAFFQAIVDAIGRRGIITQENWEEYVIDELIPTKIAETKIGKERMAK